MGSGELNMKAVSISTHLDEDEYTELRVLAAKRKLAGVGVLVTALIRRELEREAKKTAA
jgi:hypothetical protein